YTVWVGFGPKPSLVAAFDIDCHAVSGDIWPRGPRTPAAIAIGTTTTVSRTANTTSSARSAGPPPLVGGVSPAGRFRSAVGSVDSLPLRLAHGELDGPLCPAARD